MNTASTPPVPPEDIADDLDAVADLLEGRGWCRGAFEDGDDRLCLVGGLNLRFSGNPDTLRLDLERSAYERYLAARRAVIDEITTRAGTTGEEVSITTWNDRHATGQDEVVDLLRDLAVKTRPDAGDGGTL